MSVPSCDGQAERRWLLSGSSEDRGSASALASQTNFSMQYSLNNKPMQRCRYNKVLYDTYSATYCHHISSSRVDQITPASPPIPLLHAPADHDTHPPSSFRAPSQYSVPDPTVTLQERGPETRTAYQMSDKSASVSTFLRGRPRLLQPNPRREKSDTHLGDVIPDPIRQYHDDILPLRLCQLFTSAGLGEELE